MSEGTVTPRSDLMDQLGPNPMSLGKAFGGAIKEAPHDGFNLISRVAQLSAMACDALGLSTSADNLSKAATEAKHTAKVLKGTYGFAFSAVSLAKNASEGKVREALLQASNTANCGVSAVELIESIVSPEGFGAMAEAVKGYVTLGTSFASPLLDAIGNINTLRKPDPRNPQVQEGQSDEEAPKLSEQKHEAAFQVFDATMAAKRKVLEGKEHDAAQNTAKFRLMKNISHLALATITAVGLFVGAFLSAPALALVTIALSLSAIACNMISNIYKQDKESYKTYLDNFNQVAQVSVNVRKPIEA